MAASNETYTCGNCRGAVTRIYKDGAATYRCAKCKRARVVPTTQEVDPRAEAMLLKAHVGKENAAPTGKRYRPTLEELDGDERASGRNYVVGAGAWTG